MTNFDILKMISDQDRLDFSQEFSIQRPTYLGDILFPDVKTDALEAEYLRLAEGQNLPVAANVHAWDTEAKIGSRPVIEAVKIEQLLIKEKINQTEQLQRRLRYLSNDNAAVRYVYDDMGNMADRVKTRTEVAKMELLANGGFTINENNLNLAVDYGVPAEHRLTFNWTGAVDTYNPWTDMERAIQLATDAGYTVGGIMLSLADYNKIKNHPSTQTMAYGVNGAGLLIRDDQVRAIAQETLGFSNFIINENKYRVENGTTTGGQPLYTTCRYFPEGRLSFFPVGANGRVGTGLWGVTPEELRYQAFDNYSGQQFITITQWSTPDPVAVWTKATGVFIPVAPAIDQGLIIASTNNVAPAPPAPTP